MHAQQMESKLRSLKEKRARLLMEVAMLSEVSDTMFINLGKNTAEIHLLELQIVREAKNIINED